jgi:hypothetical protein
MTEQEQGASINKDQSGQPDRSRRSFLKAAPLGALAVVAGSAGPEHAAPALAAAEPQTARGYHETEHIRRYYRTASYW